MQDLIFFFKYDLPAIIQIINWNFELRSSFYKPCISKNNYRVYVSKLKKNKRKYHFKIYYTVVSMRAIKVTLEINVLNINHFY